MLQWFAALALAVACVLPGAADPAADAAPPLPQNLVFKVLLDGDEVGHHNVTFSRAGEQIVADIESAFSVTMAGFTVFEYRHRSREVWQDGAIQSIRSTTSANDTDVALNVDRSGDVLRIDGDKYKGEGPGSLIPASWWSSAIVARAQMLGQSGEILPVTVANLGRETIEAGGAPVAATHYTVTGRIEMHLWYDDQGKWVKSSFEARGSDVEYVLQPPA
jgi:hypothetical protein